MKFILCALALISPSRDPSRVGQVETTYKVEGSNCVEYTTRIGETWVDDEQLWVRKVETKFCEGAE